MTRTKMQSIGSMSHAVWLRSVIKPRSFENASKMAGSSWKPQEEERLLKELADNTKIEQIALNHNRSSGAIQSRRRHLAGVYYEDGMSIDAIMKKLNLNSTQVHKALKRRGLLDKYIDVGTQTEV